MESMRNVEDSGLGHSDNFGFVLYRIDEINANNGGRPTSFFIVDSTVE